MSIPWSCCSLVSYIQPAVNKDLVDALQKKQLTVLGIFALLVH